MCVCVCVCVCVYTHIKMKTLGHSDFQIFKNLFSLSSKCVLKNIFPKSSILILVLLEIQRPIMLQLGGILLLADAGTMC